MNKYTLFLVACVSASPAAAGELAALHGASVDLGSFRGNVFYTSQDDGYRVTATIAAGEEALPVRFVATLADGQHLMISVPGPAGAPEKAVRITRVGETLTVAPEPPGPEIAKLGE